jgi:hypothetical protein
MLRASRSSSSGAEHSTKEFRLFAEFAGDEKNLD